jgi:hypothetical protein
MEEEEHVPKAGKTGSDTVRKRDMRATRPADDPIFSPPLLYICNKNSRKKVDSGGIEE